MEFKAQVTLVETQSEIEKNKEVDTAKRLLLEAMKILTNNDAGINL